MNLSTKNLPYPAGHSTMTANLPTFDPIDMMMRRKRVQDGEEVPETVQFDPQDIKELEEFCQKHGIMGFDFGKMGPKAALAMLKGQFGMADDVVSNMEASGHRVVGKEYKQDRQILNG